MTGDIVFLASAVAVAPLWAAGWLIASSRRIRRLDRDFLDYARREDKKFKRWCDRRGFKTDIGKDGES